MVAVNIKLNIPDSIAREARADRLLTANGIKTLLQDEIRRRKVGKLFDAGDRLAALGRQPLSAEEVEAEVKAVRSSRQAVGARRR
jgi:hypothetical protein